MAREWNAEQGAVDEVLQQSEAADRVPEDVLAEQDSEERRIKREPLAEPGLDEEVPEEVLAEQDKAARAAEEALIRRREGA